MRWALLLLACAAGITSCKKERVATTVSSGAIEAKVVVVQKRQVGIDGVGGGHVGIIWPTLEKVVECELQIEKPKKLTIDVDGPCTDGYELSASPDGKALAHAVQGKSWSIVYFGSKGRSFDGVQHPAAGALDWAKVPKLEDTFVEQMRATMAEEDQSWRGQFFVPRGDLLLDEIVEGNGAAALEKVLLATIELPASTDRVAIQSSKTSLWGRGLKRLPSDASDRVVAALAGRLTDLSPSTVEARAALLRAILYVDTDRADLVPVWSKALVTWAATPSAGAPTVESEYAVGVLLARLAVRDPALAGRSACSFLTRYVATTGEESALDTTLRSDLSAALAAVAVSNEKCPAVASMEQLYEKRLGRGICLIKEWFCPAPASLLETPARVCTATEARKPVDAALGGSLDDARKERVRFEDALIAAVLRQGPPAKLAKQLARQLYTRDVPPEAPDCRGSGSLEADAGHAGRCTPNTNILDHPAMCSLKPAAAVYTSFDVHFDDTKKRIWFTDHDPATE